MRLNRVQEGRGESYSHAGWSNSGATEDVLTDDLAGFCCYVGWCSRRLSKDEPQETSTMPGGGSVTRNFIKTSSSDEPPV